MPPPPLPKLPSTTTLSHLISTLTTPKKSPFYPHPTLPTDPTMSTPPSFPTPQSLSDYLTPHIPPSTFQSWGTKPGTKNLHNLWLELSHGETFLNHSTRILQVLVLKILNKNGPNERILIESHQEMSNGDVRIRSRPLSEKMKPNESVEKAVIRAVGEELGSVLEGRDVEEIVRIVPGTYSKKVEEKESESYPGLRSCYVLHNVDVEVEGLPEGEFWSVEDEEEGKDAEGAITCKKHYWKWVESDHV